MMTRTAETLFWIGRYMERAENHTRLINVNYHLRQFLLSNEDECNWEQLISSIGDLHLFKECFSLANETTALQFLTFDQRNQNSLLSCVTQARNLIRALRQLLPSELWDSINGFYLWFHEQNMEELIQHSPYFFFQRTKEWIALFNGTASSTMARNHVWDFMQAGKYFERTETSMRILDSYSLYFPLDMQTNYNRLISLLKSAGGYEAFRKLHADNVNFAKVTDFLIYDPTFPNSITFSLSKMESYLSTIKQQDYPYHLLAEKALQFITEVKMKLANLHHQPDARIGLDSIHDMLDSINKLGLEISKTFFQKEFVSV